MVLREVNPYPVALNAALLDTWVPWMLFRIVAPSPMTMATTTNPMASGTRSWMVYPFFDLSIFILSNIFIFISSLSFFCCINWLLVLMLKFNNLKLVVYKSSTRYVTLCYTKIFLSEDIYTTYM